MDSPPPPPIAGTLLPSAAAAAPGAAPGEASAPSPSGLDKKKDRGGDAEEVRSVLTPAPPAEGRGKVVKSLIALRSLSLPSPQPDPSSTPATACGRAEVVVSLPSEVDDKRAKFEALRLVCSCICDEFLHVSGQDVAQDADILDAAGISHVVNCAGPQCPNALEHLGKIKYMRVNLYDHHSEDLTWFMYGVFDFIREAKRAGGKVLIHCAQGVSRSCAFAIAWIMWSQNVTYEEAYSIVRSKRAICSPNAGFIGCLLEWHKRRAAPSSCLAWRTAFHVPFFPHEVVLKLCSPPQSGAHSRVVDESMFDPRTCLIVALQPTPTASEAGLFLWVGEQSTASMQALVLEGVRWLTEYEGLRTTQNVTGGWEGESIVFQGRETKSFLRAMGRDAGIVATPLTLQVDLTPTPMAGEASEDHHNQAPAAQPAQAPASTDSMACEKVRLFECERTEGSTTDKPFTWNHIAVYDDQDLAPGGCFLLVQGLGRASFAWLGTDFDGISSSPDQRDNVKSFLLTEVNCGAMAQSAVDHEVAMQSVQVVYGGQESDSFWSLFEAGY